MLLHEHQSSQRHGLQNFWRIPQVANASSVREPAPSRTQPGGGVVQNDVGSASPPKPPLPALIRPGRGGCLLEKCRRDRRDREPRTYPRLAHRCRAEARRAIAAHLIWSTHRGLRREFSTDGPTRKPLSQAAFCWLVLQGRPSPSAWVCRALCPIARGKLRLPADR